VASEERKLNGKTLCRDENDETNVWCKTVG